MQCSGSTRAPGAAFQIAATKPPMHKRTMHPMRHLNGASTKATPGLYQGRNLGTAKPTIVWAPIRSQPCKHSRYSGSPHHIASDDNKSPKSWLQCRAKSQSSRAGDLALGDLLQVLGYHSLNVVSDQVWRDPLELDPQWRVKGHPSVLVVKDPRDLSLILRHVTAHFLVYLPFRGAAMAKEAFTIALAAQGP